jgi:hypothetical protein
MFNSLGNRPFSLRGLSLAAVIAGAMSIVATGAVAGERPADKMGANLTKPSAMAAKDVTDVVLAGIALSLALAAQLAFRLKMPAAAMAPATLPFARSLAGHPGDPIRSTSARV